MSHYHVTTKRPGLPSFTSVVREAVPGHTPTTYTYECACEGGEEQLYHDGIETGEIEEQCPCQDCQSDRNARFAQWKAQQEKAGIVL